MSDESIALLRRIHLEKSLYFESLSDADRQFANFLEDQKLIEIYMDGSLVEHPCVCNVLAFFDQEAERNARLKAEAKARELRDWIRWGVTAAIALAGLVNSILARIG
jgi:hypothetical protein